MATELGGPFDAEQKVSLGAGMMKAALSPEVDTFSGTISKPDIQAIDAYLNTHGFPEK